MDKISCETVFSDGSLTARISGEIDHHTAKPLREKLDREIMLYRAPRVTLDLSGVCFMDSAGLGLILGRYAKIRELGGRLYIAGASPEVERILRLAGADKLATMIESEVVK